MEGRNPERHRSFGGLEDFVNASTIRPVFWRNQHGTCQIWSLFFSFLVFNGQLIRDLADSDGPGGFISQSLWTFVRDSERPGQSSYITDGNDTVNTRLLLGGVYIGVKDKEKEKEEEEDKKKKKKKKKQKKQKKQKKKKNKGLKYGIQPDEMYVTVTRIFEKLDNTKWQGRLYANVDKAHSAKDVRELMETRTTMFVKTEELALENIAKLVHGVTGKAAFIIHVTLTSNSKNNYHAITVVFDSKFGRYLRCDNGHPRVLDSVEKNRFLCEADPRVFRVKEAFVMYVATSLDEPAPKDGIFEKKQSRPLTRSEVKAMVRAELADDLEGTEDEGEETAEATEREGTDRSEGDEDEAVHDRQENEEERIDAVKKAANIKFIDLPNLNQVPLMDEVVIKIRSQCGTRELKWTGALRGTEYICSDPPANVKCPNKTAGLLSTANEDEIKEFLLVHRPCHKGTEPGKRRPDFPVQSKKGPPRKK